MLKHFAIEAGLALVSFLRELAELVAIGIGVSGFAFVIIIFVAGLGPFR